MRTPSYLAGLELGGTKCIAVLAGPSGIVDRFAIPTGAPDATLDALGVRLAAWAGDHEIGGLGIASFGPLARGRGGDFTGMGRTPKPGWSDIAIVERFAGLGVPILMETDVAGAAIAEQRHGDAAGVPLLAYLTIGTGVGGALALDGQPVQGAHHAELGHLRVRRLPGDSFPGTCPFHGDCLEGLASGPAIAGRAGAPAETLPPGHPAWAPVADAIAEALAMLALATSPDIVMLGGSVALGSSFPLAAVRRGIGKKLAGYVSVPDVRPASLGAEAGPLGALALAGLAFSNARAGSR